VEVNHAAEIDEIFDAISYRKGASVIRMLQSYLGAEVFQKSLAAYIKNHAYSNAKTEDLWAALEAGSGEPVNKLMSSWTKQKGYPVVSAKIKDGKLELEQSRFLSSGSPGEGQWIVPVTLCCGSYEKRKNFLLESKSGAYDLKELLGCSIADGSDKINGTCSWIKINVDQAGFYRVKYDDSLAAGLRNATESQSLTSIDRYGILDDSFALTMARQQSLASLLTLCSAYKKELDYTVLSNLIAISYKVVKIGADANQELMSGIKHFFIGVFQFAAGKLGWDPKQGESHLDAMLRGEVLTALAVFGHDETLKEAVRRFDAFLADRNTPLLPPDIRRAAYVAVMQRANKSDKSGYESLLRVYRETDLSQEKTRILGSLASCPDPTIVQDVLNFVLSDEVRNQDALYGLSGVSWEGREVAWKWLQEKWEYIGNTWGSGFLITRFISAVVSPFASFEKAKEVEEFFATRSKPSMARTLKQSIERVHINANWVESIKKEDNLTQLVAQLSSN
jgi:puromycin-sensitive aminopeptidase